MFESGVAETGSHSIISSRALNPFPVRPGELGCQGYVRESVRGGLVWSEGRVQILLYVECKNYHEFLPFIVLNSNRIYCIQADS